MAKAYGWASRVMVIALEMAVPALVGYWVDQRLGFKALFVLLGVVLGMGLGMWHLMQIAGGKSDSEGKDESE